MNEICVKVKPFLPIADFVEILEWVLANCEIEPQVGNTRSTLSEVITYLTILIAESAEAPTGDCMARHASCLHFQNDRDAAIFKLKWGV